MAWADTSSSFATVPYVRHRAAPARPARPGRLARLWDRYQGWRAQRETLRILHSLDHATLRDIGVSPRQVDALVYGDGADTIRSYDHNWWRK